MDLNVNVNGTVKVVLDAAFDVEKLAAMLARTLASPVEQQRDEEKPAKKQRAAKAAKAEPTEPIASEPAVASEPKKDEAPVKEPLSEEEVTALRKAVADFIHADEGNKTKVKDWLTAHHLNRVPDITKDLLAEFNAFVGAE